MNHKPERLLFTGILLLILIIIGQVFVLYIVLHPARAQPVPHIDHWADSMIKEMNLTR